MWIDDQVLARCEEALALELWIPQQTLVVLGRSNRMSSETFAERCARDGVEVLKRLGGGGTVLLHSGCLVVSVGAWVREFYANDRYFRLLNQAIIDTISMRLPERTLEQKGYSDIVCEGRKLVGTSLFRSRNYLLYQASILVETRMDQIEKYLPHPSAEPQYRQGRSHKAFLMGLEDLVELSPHDWLRHFQEHLNERVRFCLSEELIEVPEEQTMHVKGRQGELFTLT